MFGGITDKLDEVAGTIYRVDHTIKQIKKLPLLPPKKAPKDGLYINGKPAPFERFDWSDDSEG